MAFLRKLPKSPFWIACFVNAKGVMTNRSTKLLNDHKNRKDAQNIANKLEAAARDARRGEMSQAQALKVLSEMVIESTGEGIKSRSIQTHFADYIATRLRLNLITENSAKRYRPVCEGFLKQLGPKRAAASIASVTIQEVERFRDSQIAAGKSGTTTDNAVVILRAVLEDARRAGYSNNNPADGVSKTRAMAEEREVFEPAELRNLMNAAAGTDWEGMILVAVHCGLRLQDAANLTWKNVDLSTGILSHTAAKTKRSKKGNSIVMHQQLVAWLEERAGVDDPNAPLFPALHGMVTSGGTGLSTRFNRLMDEAGVTYTISEVRGGVGRRFKSKSFHALRHSMVSRLANAGVSSDVRQAMAGHASDRVHKKYTHMEAEAQRKAVKLLDSI